MNPSKNEKIQVDGILDTLVYDKMPHIENLSVKFPLTDKAPKDRTEVWLKYDEENIYLFIKCHFDSNPVVQLQKRDAPVLESDGVGIVLDPLNKKTNGYLFWVNAFNARSDGLVAQGSVDLSWDQKWISGTKRYSNHYDVEIAIPFRSIKFDKDLNNWGFNIIRAINSKNEIHSLSAMPIQFSEWDLGYVKTMEFGGNLPQEGHNFSLNPYLATNYRHNDDDNYDFDLGLDGKFTVASTLNVDFTANPDFSQVEVDRQVVNLTRFSVFFPERRPFFLENADVFNEFGIFPDQPFFSRRIGLDPEGNPIPIYGGIRLTGNLNPKFRIGFMDVHSKSSVSETGQNYMALTVNHRIMKRSLFKAIFLNRQEMNGDSEDPYGRNLGGEFYYSNDSGTISGWAGYIHSFKKTINKENFTYYGLLGISGRSMRSTTYFQSMKKDYYADMGFIGRLIQFNPVTGEEVRLSYKSLTNSSSYTWYKTKEGSKLVSLGFNVFNSVYLDSNDSFNEWNSEVTLSANWRNTSTLGLTLSHADVNLLVPFSISPEEPLPIGGYRFNNMDLGYKSNRNSKFLIDLSAAAGSFYNGKITSGNVKVGYRLQPYGNINLAYEKNILDFPNQFGDSNLDLLINEINLSLTNKLFINSVLQLNTQQDIFSGYARLQYRYSPLSDFFLVFSKVTGIEDNPLNEHFIALKFTHWFSL
ncbi:carbohydrate binding family 9 domain-containing protein [Muricauda sp. MAR_2010_75]|uniref:carbohydrate binding family 9 domain-containing protein n=1 Tax=Allomuricauda sp. MAR_2010_75 TaxID=1250232 RepID=UPI0018CEC345|nr:carbohydrate binding family 9 domain-containing protein [Muricauda sp. MAR_2010_75]